jgi:hypothetical protein
MEEALEAAKPARIQVVSWSSQLYQRLLRLGWVVIYSHIGLSLCWSTLQVYVKEEAPAIYKCWLLVQGYGWVVAYMYNRKDRMKISVASHAAPLVVQVRTHCMHWGLGPDRHSPQPTCGRLVR